MEDKMVDWRAKLEPKPGGKKYVLGENSPDNILNILYEYNGLVFPYTPAISFGHTAEYKEYDIIHSNYSINSFIKSRPDNITLEARFTAQTKREAEYMLAAIHFFRANTKMYFGAQRAESNETKLRSGTPPPVLEFSFLGELMFTRVPVVIEKFSMALEQETQYVEVEGWDTYVPTAATFTINLNVNQNTKDVRENFNLDDFRQGKWLGNKGITGGFI